MEEWVQLALLQVHLPWTHSNLTLVLLSFSLRDHHYLAPIPAGMEVSSWITPAKDKCQTSSRALNGSSILIMALPTEVSLEWTEP